MALNACRQCGTPMPAHSHACPKCGATVAPGPIAYRPPPPRPPQEPEGSSWRTAAGWVLLLAVLAVCGIFFYRVSAGIDQHALAEEEVEREDEHVRRAVAWVQDTVPSEVPESGPVPTSDVAKRMWVIRRMLVDRAVWEREVMERHGVRRFSLPAAWNTVHFQANARAYPEVARYVDGLVAATKEIQATSPRWIGERTAALARESGVPESEIAYVFPRDGRGVPAEDARAADTMRKVHRHLVNMDPRVQPGGGDRILYERKEDMLRVIELTRELNEATESASEAREQRFASEFSAIPRVARVIRS